MAKYTLKVNQQTVEVEAMPDTPLLWVLRDKLTLTGTKYGCGLLNQNKIACTNG